MGLIRKATSVSTLGAVSCRSKRETQKRANNAAAVASREEAKLAREQRRGLEHERHEVQAADREAAAEAREAAAEKLPWYRQPTLGGAIRKYQEDHRPAD